MPIKKPIRELELTYPSLLGWATTDFGKYLFETEERIISEKYSKFPGYRCMYTGFSHNQSFLSNFDQTHAFTVKPNSDISSENSTLISDLAELPLPSEIIDVGLIQHTLEFSLSPQAVLAESCRVIAPGGHLVICVLNPLGPMGLTKLPLRVFTKRPHYQFHHLRIRRLVDWLTLLNFEVEEITHGAYRWPFRNVPNPSLKYSKVKKNMDMRNWENICNKFQLPFGNFYMVHAVKRVGRGIGISSRSWKPAVSKNLGASAQILGSKKI